MKPPRGIGGDYPKVDSHMLRDKGPIGPIGPIGYTAVRGRKRWRCLCVGLSFHAIRPRFGTNHFLAIFRHGRLAKQRPLPVVLAFGVLRVDARGPIALAAIGVSGGVNARFRARYASHNAL